MERGQYHSPTKEQIVKAAGSKGWIYAIKRGKSVLLQENPGVTLILQDIPPGSCYRHTTAASYCRTLGLEIEGGTIPPASGPGDWSPSNDEQT